MHDPERRGIGPISSSPTETPDYASRLSRLQDARWKALLHVQAPYRWKIRRLRPGFVLDVGCGIGRSLLHLDGQGVGVDHNPHAIAVARSRGLRAYTPDEFVSTVWAQKGIFDSLLMAHVLEHLTIDQAVALVRSYRQYLKRDAKVIVITPQEAGFRSDRTHVTFVDFTACEAILTAAGCMIDYRQSFPLPRFAGRWFRYNEFIVVGRITAPGLQAGVQYAATR